MFIRELRGGRSSAGPEGSQMLSWASFAAERPDIVAVGQEMLYEPGIGLAFLATSRPDGGPRVHPMCPLLANGRLYGFIVPGPKLKDLRRDGRYALHSGTFAPPRHDDAFYITGRVREPNDPSLWESLQQQFFEERAGVIDEPWPGFEDQSLVEFHVETCLVTLTEARDGLEQGHTIWKAE